jgi:tetratricopeptide (TPR) repeat protein
MARVIRSLRPRKCLEMEPQPSGKCPQIQTKPTEPRPEGADGTAVSRACVCAFLLLCLAAFAATGQEGGCLTGPRLHPVEAMLARGEFTQAVRVVERAMAAGRGCDPEAWLMLAVAYQNLQKGENAIEACARGLRAFPASERLQEHYGLALLANLPRAEAQARLEEVVRAYPDSAPLRKTLGKLLFDPPSGAPKAGEHLAAAAKLAPRDPEARYFYGLWACTSGAAWADLVGRRLPVVRDSYELCLRELTQALALTPANNFQAIMQIQANIGSAEGALGRPAQARAAFGKALEANRRLATPNPAVGLEYAQFLLEASETAEARAILDEVLARDPGYAAARFERARLLHEGGLAERAIDEANLALRDAKDNTLLRAIHSFLARTYHEIGREEEADSHQRWFQSQPGRVGEQK